MCYVVYGGEKQRTSGRGRAGKGEERRGRGIKEEGRKNGISFLKKSKEVLNTSNAWRETQAEVSEARQRRIRISLAALKKKSKKKIKIK